MRSEQTEKDRKQKEKGGRESTHLLDERQNRPPRQSRDEEADGEENEEEEEDGPIEGGRRGPRKFQALDMVEGGESPSSVHG